MNLEKFIKDILKFTKKIKKDDGVLFSEVISKVTDKKVIVANDDYIKKKLNTLCLCFDEIVKDTEINPIQKNRINEASNLLEIRLRDKINSKNKFSCGIPLTKENKKQTTGYPDLIIEGEKTIYVEVKIYKNDEKTLNSTLRTFYYEPKIETNKINNDGYHLLIGFGHTGKKVRNGFVLNKWSLIDLSKLKVIFKGEFQTNNKKMYCENNHLIKEMEKN